MITLKEEIRLVSRKEEEGFTLRESEYADIKRHIDAMHPHESPFWTGLQWSLVGGFFSALVATGGYHLFEQSPNGYALVIGYVAAAALLAMSGLLGFRGGSHTPSFSHHKEEALILLARVATERTMTAVAVALPKEGSASGGGLAVDRNLFTDLRSMKDKFGKEG